MFERRILFCFVIIVTFLIYINYILLRKNKGEIFEEPHYKSNNSGNYYLGSRCCNALFCSTEGKWILRSNITAKDFDEVLESNKELRSRKGWPEDLFRNDSKCGKKYPFSRLIRRNSTSLSYPDISSQCNPLNNLTCCNENKGLCGKGPRFCDCNGCIDYTRYLNAELSQWQSDLQCPLYEPTSYGSCSFLATKFTSVTFIGDSLVRHVFSAFLMLLTGDLKYGALKHRLKQTNREYCKGENQFVDSSCHVKLATKWFDIKENPSYCNHTEDKVKISFVQAYSTRHKNLAIDTIEKALKEKRPLIFVGIGIHDNFNSTKVIKDFLKPILGIRFPYKTSNPIFVWLNTHAAGPLKPIEFQETQGNKKIIKFNKILKQYCSINSLLIFDAFNITKGLHSFDGTHYGSVLNLFKVTLLLDGLKTVA